jgi:hypothetical protein
VPVLPGGGSGLGTKSERDGGVTAREKAICSGMGQIKLTDLFMPRKPIASDPRGR